MAAVLMFPHASSRLGWVLDMAMQLRHVDQAERHVREGARHVAEQEQGVSDLHQLRKRTEQARNILATFYVTQKLHKAHLNHILGNWVTSDDGAHANRVMVMSGRVRYLPPD